MASEPTPDELIGLAADEQLLAEGAQLPEVVGHPQPVPATRGRGAIVAAGAAMTGLTLIGGVVVLAIALIDAFANGASLLDGGLVALGIVMLATHWGWVHVAEFSARALEARQHREIVTDRQRWLSSIAPHTYREVRTEVEADGSIAIVRVAYHPVRVGENRFAFRREVELREVHSEDEPAAAVTERAEQLRREAALDTERELERYLEAADRRETAQMLAEDERERIEARRAASLALSEQINANLREPPLSE
jgi:hypothetical protein